MKNIGIITIVDNNNYGNRLQNYAVQEILKTNELEVETIVNDVSIFKNNSSKDKIKNILRPIYSFLRKLPDDIKFWRIV